MFRVTALLPFFALVSIQSTPLAQGGERITNLGAASAVVESDRLAYSEWESFRGDDLNGDGDIDDSVVHVRDWKTGETTNVGLAGIPALLTEDWLVILVSEARQGEDLNDDGDLADEVVHVHDSAAGETTNLRLAADRTVPDLLHSGQWLVFRVSVRRRAGQGLERRRGRRRRGPPRSQLDVR